MTGKQKLYFLIGRIEDARSITPVGKPVLIDPANDLNKKYREIELMQLFSKLEIDEKVVRVLQRPKTDSDSILLDPYAGLEEGCYILEILPAFDDYLLKIQQEPEYQDFTGKKPKSDIRSENKQSNIPTTQDRKALEKIWNVLQEIETKRGITSSQDDISILQVHKSKLRNLSEADAYSDERLNILRRLEEEKAIKDMRWPHDFNGLVYLKIGDKYSEVFDWYKEAYKKASQDYQQIKEEGKNDTNGVVYKVQYSETSREIIINGFLVGKPDFNRENEIVFTYVYKHPNERLSKLKIEKENNVRLLKDLPKIVENLGFTGELKKAFFDVSTEGILFRNPVTRKVLNELRIEHLKLK